MPSAHPPKKVIIKQANIFYGYNRTPGLVNVNAIVSVVSEYLDNGEEFRWTLPLDYEVYIDAIFDFCSLFSDDELNFNLLKKVFIDKKDVNAPPSIAIGKVLLVEIVQHETGKECIWSLPND
jgi:hypothetical protein